MAKYDNSTSATITLDFPFTFDGEKIEKLDMRRPKVRDNLKANRVEGSEFEKMLALAANLIERPVEIFNDMDEIDFAKVQDKYLAFTGRATTPAN